MKKSELKAIIRECIEEVYLQEKTPNQKKSGRYNPKSNKFNADTRMTPRRNTVYDGDDELTSRTAPNNNWGATRLNTRKDGKLSGSYKSRMKNTIRAGQRVVGKLDGYTSDSNYNEKDYTPKSSYKDSKVGK